MGSHVNPIKTDKVDRLNVLIYESRDDMGKGAANHVIEKMKELLENKDTIRMVFAAAPSQNEFLKVLTEAEGIDWSRVTAFHMDEYIGLTQDAQQRFSHFLNESIFDIVKPGKLHLINSSNSIEEECKRYGDLIAEGAIDIVCLGIGENGHIAFNDPPVADFKDPKTIKPVELDKACRQQQVNDGCFTSFEDVPTHALTLTVPTLMSGAHLYCIVPGSTKAQAVYNTLYGGITTDCPASILRRHSDAVLYVDNEAYQGQS